MADETGASLKGEEARWRTRQRQVAALSDHELRVEAADFAGRDWQRSGRRSRHLAKHRRAIEAALGRPLQDPEYWELALSVASQSNRVFTEIAPGGDVACHFVREAGRQGAIIVTVRGPFLRTVLATARLDLWLMRHGAAVEVTSRVVGP